MSRRRRAGGFTLIEVLVAVAVFAVMSAIMFMALNEVLNGAAESRDELDRLADIQRTFTIMADDFNQAAPRAVRDQYGDTAPPMLLQDQRLTFTRAGYRNLRDRSRSTLRRVGYGLMEGRVLTRYTWTSVDQPIEPHPNAQTLLTGVRDLRVRYRFDGEWLDDWPPLVPNGTPPALPEAVSIQLDLEDYGAINRTFALP